MLPRELQPRLDSTRQSSRQSWRTGIWLVCHGPAKNRLTAVEDGAGGCACWRVLVIRVRLGNANDQGLLLSRSIVERADTCLLIGYPPRTAGTARYAPRINQLRVCDWSSRCVGNKIDSRVVLRKACGSHDQSQGRTRGKTLYQVQSSFLPHFSLRLMLAPASQPLFWVTLGPWQSMASSESRRTPDESVAHRNRLDFEMAATKQ